MLASDTEAKSSKFIFLRTIKIKMSSSLCPHVLKEYTLKVGEVLETYKPQILAKVKFADISQSLLSYHVIKKKEIDKLVQLYSTNSDQLQELLEFIKKRMWGLENFITVLVDRNVDSWLSEELFQTYVRHVVVNLKKMQAQNTCSCFQAGGGISKMDKAWMTLWDTLDKYLNEVGESLGFLTFTLHPTGTVLNFINEMLPTRTRRKKLLLVDNEDEYASDQESEVDKKRDTSFHDHDHDHHIITSLGHAETNEASAAEDEDGSIHSSSLLSIYESCSSLTDSELNKVLGNIKDNIQLSSDLVSLVAELQSVSLQEEYDEKGVSSPSQSQALVSGTGTEIGDEGVPDNSEKPKMPIVSVSHVNQTNTNRQMKLPSTTSGKPQPSIHLRRTSSTKNSITPTKKDVTSSSSSTTTKKVGVATARVTPRQRVVQEFRAKRANAPPPSPPPKNDQRLSPQDYNCQNQQWVLFGQDRSIKKQPQPPLSHANAQTLGNNGEIGIKKIVR